MTFPTDLTFDIIAAEGGARRPANSDVGLDSGGAGQLSDEAGSPPAQDGTDMCAAMMHQWEMQLAALGRMVSATKLTIQATGAARAIIQSQFPGTTVVNGDFSITRDSAGVTRIEWTSTDLVPPTCWPEVTTHGASGSVHGGSCVLDLNTAGAGAGTPTPGTHRIIVTTHTAGVVADISFTVSFN